MDRRAQLNGKIENVLVVVYGYDEDAARVLRPPLGVHLHEDLIVLVQHFERMVSYALLDIATERTPVAKRGMRDH